MKVFGLSFFLLLASGLVSAQIYTYTKIDESVAVDNGSWRRGMGIMCDLCGWRPERHGQHRQFTLYHEPFGRRGEPRFLYQR